MVKQEPTRVEREPSRPWWRYPLVWMVIAGPAMVVAAGFTTLWLAVSRPDPVMAQDVRPDKTHLPAMAGRNHAATTATAPLPTPLTATPR